MLKKTLETGQIKWKIESVMRKVLIYKSLMWKKGISNIKMGYQISEWDIRYQSDIKYQNGISDIKNSTNKYKKYSTPLGQAIKDNGHFRKERKRIWNRVYSKKVK